MQAEQNALEHFVRLHGSKYKNVQSSERVAFLATYSEVMPLDVRTTRYTSEHIIKELNTEDTTVRFLLHQMKEYDVLTQNVLGLIFQNGTVLAHVIQCGSIRDDS